MAYIVGLDITTQGKASCLSTLGPWQNYIEQTLEIIPFKRLSMPIINIIPTTAKHCPTGQALKISKHWTTDTVLD